MASSTLSLIVSKSREDMVTKLDKIAENLGCRRSDLIWQAMQGIVENPPKEAPAGSRPSTGTSPGFWVVPVMDKAGGKATGVRIVEVESRGDIDGRTFFRYKVEEDDAEKTAKARDRAAGQAQRAAEFDCKLLGIPTSSIKVEKLAEPAPGGSGKSATTGAAPKEASTQVKAAEKSGKA